MSPQDSIFEYQKSTGFNFTQKYSPPRIVTPKKLVETGNLFNYQASILEDNRVVLFKKGKQMGSGYYIIEISSNRESFYITAFNVECSQTLVLQLDSDTSKEFIKKFD